MCPAPSITPSPPDDVDVYIVLDDFGGKLDAHGGKARRTDRSQCRDD